MQTLLQFLSLADPNVRYVVLGTMLLTSSSAMVGSFALLKKKALVGDAIAHAVFPGVCLSFILTGDKHPIYLTLGAFATSWLSLYLIDIMPVHTKIKEDTAIALVLSITFGLGTLLLSIIQRSGNAAQVGLSNFLFGKAAALLGDDLLTLAILSLFITITLILFFKEFALIAFDKAFAQAIGLPVRHLEAVFTSLTVLAIVLGIRAVGIVLMAAMLITPAAAARLWTDQLPKMVLLSAVLGMIASIAGSFVSYIAPGMSTGPWIVLAITLIAYSSLLLAPRKGLLAKKLRRRRHQQKTLAENILKLFYELGEREGEHFFHRPAAQLLVHRPMPLHILMHGLRSLQRQGLVQQRGDTWRLTEVGEYLGQQISQRHQLWEFYLTRHLKIKPDHVHEDAESIEHVLTPTLVRELRKSLENMQ
ncbi:MAG: iron chelate uptake ABC transporter family permease subunit [Bacteroidota bacterium]